jgi:glutamate racemase
MPDARPIGLFDSGVGGLTVLRQVIRRLPQESTIYLGDNARTPYGTRPDEEVRRFSLECLDEIAARDVKALVVACNTTSAVALGDARRRYPMPVLGVVRPGAAAAALATRSGRVGVIATPATVRSRAYSDAIADEDPGVLIVEHATPELVPLVEAGRLDGPEVEAIVARSLAPLLAGRGEGSPGGTGKRIDTLLLGCTHYPLLEPIIGRLAGPDVAVIDSATATASALAELLAVTDLLAPEGHPARHLQLTTGETAAFERTAERLFGPGFHTVESIALAGVA